MSTKNTFYEIAVAQANKQSVIVDSVTNEAPILASIPMEPTSNGLNNIYEEVTAVTGAELMDYDAVMPTMSSDSELKFEALSSIGGQITVGIDKARQMGSPEAYFNKHMPNLLRQTGCRMEFSVLYNNLRNFAVASGRCQDAGGAGSTNYSIIAVKWVPGVITGLYDPSGFGRGVAGSMFEMGQISGGTAYPDAAGRLVYGMYLKTYFGMQLADARYVSAIANCDVANDTVAARTFPTEEDIDQLIHDARGASVIFCHPRVLSYLYKYKGDRLATYNMDNQINRQFQAWNGVPIMTSYNFIDGTEDKATI